MRDIDSSLFPSSLSLWGCSAYHIPTDLMGSGRHIRVNMICQFQTQLWEYRLAQDVFILQIDQCVCRVMLESVLVKVQDKKICPKNVIVTQQSDFKNVSWCSKVTEQERNKNKQINKVHINKIENSSNIISIPVHYKLFVWV